jgi:hypothetical protein
MTKFVASQKEMLDIFKVAIDRVCISYIIISDHFGETTFFQRPLSFFFF